MRKLTLVLVAALAGVFFYVAPAQAMCVAPSVSVDPAKGAPGDEIVVKGAYFAGDCNDTVVCQEGQPCTEPPKAAPQTGIDVVFEQNGQQWPLGTVDASPDDYSWTLSAKVPVAETGKATIEANGAPEPAAFEVVNGAAIPEGGTPVPPEEEVMPISAPDPDAPVDPEAERLAATSGLPISEADDIATTSGDDGIGGAVAGAIAAAALLGIATAIARRRKS